METEKLKELEERKVRVDYLHFIFMIAVVTILVIAVIINRNPDTDAYFIINNGDYIFNNLRLPSINIWTIHSDFAIVIQQWICSVINYIAYRLGGFVGTVILAFILSIILNIVLYKYIATYTNNKKVHIIIQCIINLAISQYFTTRPYTVTMSIITFELICLNNFYSNEITTKSKRNIFIQLIIISLLLINYQSATWSLIFIMLLPYLAPWILNKKWRKQILSNHNVVIYRTIPFMLCTGFINPNGIKGITYLFDSYSAADTGNYISEMVPPNVVTLSGIVLITTIILFVVCCCKRETNKTFIYLSIGTIILAYMHGRNSWLLMFTLIQSIALILNDIEALKKQYKTWKLNYCIILCSYLLTLIIVIGVALGIASAGIDNHTIYRFKEATDYLDTLDKDDITLYTEFDNGQMFELFGYKAYIDARPELYMAKINGKEDIYTEYLDVKLGKIDIREFIDKYKFTHFAVMKNNNMDSYLNYSGKYELISENESYRLYEDINFNKDKGKWKSTEVLKDKMK